MVTCEDGNCISIRIVDGALVGTSSKPRIAFEEVLPALLQKLVGEKFILGREICWEFWRELEPKTQRKKI